MKLPQALKPILHPILSRTPVGDADRYLLELDLGRGVSETPPTNPLQALTKMHTPQLRTLVSQLKKAATDDAVVGLIAQIAAPPLTLAQSGELRDAVATFRETGKPTLVFSPSFGELTPGTTGYHLASAFEEIWLQPSGAVGLVGFAGEAMTVRGTLDLLQVEPQFGQRHEFKTAADTFMAHEITAPHREMLTRLLVSATDTVVADVAHGRRLTTDHVRAIIDGGPLGAAAAQRAGLIDKIGYRDEAYAAIRSRLSSQPGRPVPEPELRYVERWGAGPFDALLGGGGPLPSRKPVIALVTAAGPIA
ncbi:MAG: S49 family peptidase, partial [Nocardioides sp.]